ncbi:methylmalonyl Co-A mutase-associated GTPase MeaB [Emticicia sp. BO119]|uniref:methylmalonyl Co-A mutase-associated GTPase MeaB n=1 Tax=Emticicia sp. BO119 TaxID=2757768 RepID=UPI0015F032B3|nr:methylmalonyl Co-A mutase-associated GTPase MeaB [Emticicia sp. BO119]MBA4850030.1 methylmalonyl Co-A mutase-associated GTPase MeaB [Emticicia sp. BO119]
MHKRLSLDEYRDGILAGNRVILSRAITLIESHLPQDKTLAQNLVEQLLPNTGNSIRIGITGVPGVGKSTFIEAFGKSITAENRKIAVLAIDPTSQITKGSIMGDKTRMEELAHNPLAYIRPTPAGDSLGGVANKTRETILLCEAAGFEIIIVETVGVGQSETLVKSMVDFFLLLMLAGAGDELQGIKRGIIEMADAIAITKADGNNLQASKNARLEYLHALHLYPSGINNWQTPVMTCSAINNKGINEIWETIQSYIKKMKLSGFLEQNRQQQNIEWLYTFIRQTLENDFFNNSVVIEKFAGIKEKISSGKMLPIHGAKELLKYAKSAD